MVKRHQFKKEDLIDLFKQVRIKEQIIQKLNKPLEKKPWHLYQMLFVSEWRIQHGVEFWQKYASVLKKAEKIYGVPPGIIVATLGIETKYGQRMGDYRVIDSLTNLAFSPSPRAKFFRKELEEFFLMAREQHLDPLKVMGSYAGAIGQPQFMPSSYRHYAINFSHSGKTDLMHDVVDVIGSIAHYYQKHGWQRKGLVALPALMSNRHYTLLKQKHQADKKMTLKELRHFGIIAKKPIRVQRLQFKVIELDSHSSKEYWLGSDNFDVIKRYNASDLYAMAVYQLSEYITELHQRLNKG